MDRFPVSLRPQTITQGERSDKKLIASGYDQQIVAKVTAVAHPRTYWTRQKPTQTPRYLRSGPALEYVGVDEEILELWEAACNSICEAEPPAPLEAIAVLDLIARDATRLVDEQIVRLLGDGVATPTTIGQALGMSRQSVI